MRLQGAWVNCLRPDPEAPWRLWCLPFAGGGASAFAAWPAPLAGIAEVAAIRPAGRENRLLERPHSHWRPAVEEILAAAAPHLNRRYALLGYSLGALLAFEFARLARARGLPGPGALVILGARAPGLPRREPDLRALPDEAFLTELDCRYGGVPPAVRAEPELLALLLPVMRADLTVFETYVYEPGPPLDCAVLALGGDADPNVDASEVAAWRAHTNGPFESALLPGGHFFAQTGLPAVATRVAQFMLRIAI